MPLPFTIRVLAWDEAAPLARPVREAVFVVEQGVPLEMEWDDDDARCRHAVALDAAGTAIGTARLLPEGRIGRMAVGKAWRGQGVGAALMRALLGEARAAGMAAITLHAQTHATGFYRRFGFSVRGDEFLEAGIPHFEMTLALRAAPPPA
jgi:predicted GNAT family N-acyltransferase